MSTQIRFRLSGEEEQAFLQAAKRAGLSPDAYARTRALTPINPEEAMPMALMQRLATMEVMLNQLAKPPAIPGTKVSGLEAADLLLAIRDECVRGVNGFLRILEGETLDSPMSRRETPDKPN